LIFRAGIVLLLLAPAAVAQAPDSVDAPRVALSVEHVVTGGTWKVASAAGRYRAIGVSRGWEEIRHRVILEWIQVPDTAAADSLYTRLELNDALGLYGLADPKLVRRGKNWFLELKAATRPLKPYTETVLIELGPPGKIRRVRHL
jgi:hypothetical protein